MEIDRFTKFHHVAFGAFESALSVQVPPFQRALNEDRVNKFVDILVNFFEEFGSVVSLGVITIGKLASTNEHFLLDGQHRYHSYKKFSDNFELEGLSDFQVPVMIRDFEDLEELKAFFCAINDHYSPPEFVRSVETMDRAQVLRDHLRRKYAAFLSSKSRTRFPCVPLDAFVSFVLERLEGVSTERLVERFEELNASVGDAMKIMGEGERHTILLIKGGLFYVHTYCRANSRQRQAIPQSVRRDVWSRQFSHSTEGACTVCARKVFNHDFHVGHVVAIARGGTDVVSNLNVVCAPCNYSMGVMNLDDFRTRYYGLT